ncbi:hypothetical protein Tco_1510687 [Tanacetum coccineum]
MPYSSTSLEKYSGSFTKLRGNAIQLPTLLSKREIRLRSNDCRNYPECEICGSYDHFTVGHNHVIHIRGGALAESSQSE